jgi:hypothetical protein
VPKLVPRKSVRELQLIHPKVATPTEEQVKNEPRYFGLDNFNVYMFMLTTIHARAVAALGNKNPGKAPSLI